MVMQSGRQAKTFINSIKAVSNRLEIVLELVKASLTKQAKNYRIFTDEKNFNIYSDGCGLLKSFL